MAVVAQSVWVSVSLDLCRTALTDSVALRRAGASLSCPPWTRPPTHRLPRSATPRPQTSSLRTSHLPIRSRPCHIPRARTRPIPTCRTPTPQSTPSISTSRRHGTHRGRAPRKGASCHSRTGLWASIQGGSIRLSLGCCTVSGKAPRRSGTVPSGCTWDTTAWRTCRSLYSFVNGVVALFWVAYLPVCISLAAERRKYVNNKFNAIVSYCIYIVSLI